MTFSPTRFTPALSDDFKADIDRLLYNAQGERPGLLELAWSAAYGKEFRFDEWQVEILRRVTELLPAPDDDPKRRELRFRSCILCVPRQAGKTETVAALSLYSLLRGKGEYSLNIASTADQARLIYDRLQQIIQANPSLDNAMTKITDTRGIRTNKGSRYEIKASKSAALQGIPVAVAIVDEVHLVADETWSALQTGLGGRTNAILVGISTAGDEDSHLLKRLYETADKAIAGEVDRFGAWIWEASETVVPRVGEKLDEDKVIKLLIEANPALQSGRVDPKIILADVALEPDVEIVRYRFNRFVNSSANSFIPFELWLKTERSMDDQLPPGQVVFAIDRTPNWEYATVSAAVKVGDVIHTEIVASIVKPTLERLVYICAQLQTHNPRAIVMDATFLRDLDNELELRGIQSTTFNNAQLCEAASTFYALIKQEKLVHAPDPLLSFQIPRTSRRNVGDAFKVSRKDSSIEIDAVMSTVLACYGANTLPEVELQVF